MNVSLLQGYVRLNMRKLREPNAKTIHQLQFHQKFDLPHDILTLFELVVSNKNNILNFCDNWLHIMDRPTMNTSSSSTSPNTVMAPKKTCESSNIY